LSADGLSCASLNVPPPISKPTGDDPLPKPSNPKTYLLHLRFDH